MKTFVQVHRIKAVAVKEVYVMTCDNPVTLERAKWWQLLEYHWINFKQGRQDQKISIDETAAIIKKLKESA